MALFNLTFCVTKRARLVFNFCLIWQVQTGSWCRHQTETFSALLARCEGNSPFNGDIDIYFRVIFAYVCWIGCRSWAFDLTYNTIHIFMLLWPIFATLHKNMMQLRFPFLINIMAWCTRKPDLKIRFFLFLYSQCPTNSRIYFEGMLTLIFIF